MSKEDSEVSLQSTLTPKKSGLLKLKLAANLVSKSQSFVSKLRSCRASDLLQESYNTVAELCSGSGPTEESIFETSRRRTGDAIFSNFSAQSDGTDAAKSAHVGRIRREMAARMRAVKSLSLATRSSGEHGPGPDCAIHRDDDCVEEDEHVELPVILTRHPDEEALLVACNSRLAVLRSEIQKAEDALDKAGVFELWSTFQEFCVNRAIRRRSRSRRAALEHIGMRDLRELLLTFTFRADRWLHTHNDPLVHVLSEYECSINELLTAQELRVTAAKEVLASMKLIAESSRAGREAFLSVRGQVQDATVSYGNFLDQLSNARVLLQNARDVGNELRDFHKIAEAHINLLNNGTGNVSSESSTNNSESERSDTDCYATFCDAYHPSSAHVTPNIFVQLQTGASNNEAVAEFHTDPLIFQAREETADDCSTLCTDESQAATAAEFSANPNSAIDSADISETKTVMSNKPVVVEYNRDNEAEIILSIKEAAAWFKASGEVRAAVKARAKANTAIVEEPKCDKVVVSHAYKDEESDSSATKNHSSEIEVILTQNIRVPMSDSIVATDPLVHASGQPYTEAPSATNGSCDVAIALPDHVVAAEPHSHSLNLSCQTESTCEIESECDAADNLLRVRLPAPTVISMSEVTTVDSTTLVALELIALEIDNIRDAIIDESQSVAQPCCSSHLPFDQPFEDSRLDSISLKESDAAVQKVQMSCPSTQHQNVSESSASFHDHMLASRWLKPMAYERRMLDEAQAAAVSAEAMRANREILNRKRMEALKKSMEYTKALPILDFIKMKVMQIVPPLEAARGRRCTRSSDPSTLKRSHPSILKSRNYDAERCDDKQGFINFQPAGPVTRQELFPALPSRATNAAHVRGYTMTPRCEVISGSDLAAGGDVHLQRRSRFQKKRDRLRNAVAGLGEEQLMRSIVAVFRCMMGLSSNVARTVQQNIMDGVYKQIRGWHHSQDDFVSQEAAPTLNDTESNGEAPTTVLIHRSSCNRLLGSSTPEDNVISPRLFPSFKPASALKSQVRCSPAVHQKTTHSVDSVPVEKSELSVAAAASHVAVQVLPRTRFDCSDSSTTQEHGSKKIPDSSLMSYRAVEVSHNTAGSTASRPTTATTRPSSSGSISFVLPRAQVVQSMQPQPPQARSVSNSSLSFKRKAETSQPRRSLKPSVGPVVPSLDIAAVDVLKRQHDQSQVSMKSGRVASLCSARMFELSVALSPPYASARGCSGRKLVSGVPVSKTFAKQRQQHHTGNYLSDLSCSPLSAKRLALPSQSHPQPSSSHFVPDSTEEADVMTSTVWFAYREYCSRHQL